MDQGRDAYDVAIVGGGAIGSAVAWFLLSDPAFDGSVAVIERDPTYRHASSALSAGSIRQQFSTPENVRMSRFGFTFLRDLAGGADGEDVGLEERGYLYLATAEHAAALRRTHAIQVTEGASVVLLDPDELAGRFPWLDVHGVELGSLGVEGEGWFDGYALLQALRGRARGLGADYLRAEALGLRVRNDRVEAVTLAGGRAIRAGTVVNAAGPWARSVAAMAGVALPVEARRRCVFVFDAQIELPACPLVIDTSGAWFRPEGRSFICGTSPPDGHDPDGLPLEVDPREFEEVLWPALAARVPGFDAIKLVRSWAGYYEYNTFDQNALLGAHPERPNLLFANGFSGHGLQHAPAVGRAIAELIVHGRYVTLDLSVFSVARLAEGRRVVEEQVIG